MISLLNSTSHSRGLLLRLVYGINGSLAKQIQRNKAILASQIIKTIADSPLNQYSSNQPCPSLRQKILCQIDNYKVDIDEQVLQERNKICAAVRKALRKYFVDGVWVPYDMCSQFRFNEQIQQYGQLKKESEDVEINVVQEDEASDLKFRKIKFCPTYFVTGQIFRKILHFAQIRFLTGQYGVGKTYSFILYTLLSEIIYRYRYNYHPQSKMRQWELSTLYNIPKSFYWCINKDTNYHEPIELNKLLKRQFYELRGIPEFSGNFKEFSIGKLIQKHFEIKTVLLMDQISELAAILRNQINFKIQVIKRLNLPEYNAYVKNIDLDKGVSNILRLHIPQAFKSQTERMMQSDLQIPLNYKKYSFYKSSLLNMIYMRHFNKFRYLSSVDIEKYLLDQLQLVGQSRQSNIRNHSQRIFYPASFYGDVQISDTVEFITFHLQNRWISGLKRDLSNEENDMLEQVKCKFSNHLKKQQFIFFLPLNIHQTITSSSRMEFKIFMEKYSTKKLDQHIIEQIKLLKNNSAQQMEIKLKQFLKKDMPTPDLEKAKYVILNEFWGQSKKILKNLNQKNENNLQHPEKQDETYNQEKRRLIQDRLPIILY